MKHAWTSSLIISADLPLTYKAFQMVTPQIMLGGFPFQIRSDIRHEVIHLPMKGIKMNLQQMLICLLDKIFTVPPINSRFSHRFNDGSVVSICFAAL